MNDMSHTQPREFHPFSEIWPLLEGEALDNLALDIAANGLQLPILIYQDKVLDGRNRELACIEAGVERRYEQSNAKDDDEALKLVVSMNEHRRHLSFEQRSFAGARLVEIKQGSHWAEKRKLTLSQDNVSSDDPSQCHGSRSVKEAAALMAVAPVSVSRARAVLTHAPELEKDIIAKKISLKTACDTARPKRIPKGGRPGGKPRDYGMPVASRVPVIDSSHRRVLTPAQVDPEFTGTANEFTTKYGHVQLETAEERATNRFKEWTIHIRRWARDWKEQGALSEIDVNWLRSPHGKDVESFLESYAKLAVVFDNIQAIRDKVKALKEKTPDEEKS